MARTTTLTRTPRPEIRRQLRQDVGFGCPIEDCGLPYLEWHHFDPPWKERHHENPDGIIALCPNHHAKADRGTWTKEQLRQFKRAAKLRRKEVKGKFEWMRDRLLGVAGGNFAYDVKVLFYCSQQPIIWFTRDAQGYIGVNLSRPLSGSDAEPIMVNNDWTLPTDIPDIECNPGGQRLAVNYHNGDMLMVEFHEMASNQEAANRYAATGQSVSEWLADKAYPLLAVEFKVKIPSLRIDIRSGAMKLPGENTVRGCVAENAAIAFAVGNVPHHGGSAFRLG